MKTKYLIIFLLFSIMLTSCGSVDPVQGALDPTAVRENTLANASGQPAAEGQPAAPVAAAIPAATSPAVEAWLVTALEENNILLRAISTTGKPLRELGAIGNPAAARFAASANPEQFWFSLYSSEDNGLTIMNILADGSSELIPLLKSKDLSAEKKSQLAAEFLRADQPAQVWSPDGTRLAYLDVTAGEKTSLMLYDVTTKTSAALSQGAEDVTAPVWSPDGQWVLYQTIDGFPAQGLPQVTGMHIVSANGSADRLLYTPASLRETVLGWASADVFAVQSTIERGNRDLRLISVKDGSSQSLNAGLVKNAAWEGKSQTAMYLLTASETNNEQPSGVYAVTATSPQRMVLPGKWETLQLFQPAGVWLAALPGEIGIIRPDGSTASIQGAASVKAVSPDGRYLAADNPAAGALLYGMDGASISTLANKPIGKAFFTPDSQKLFFTVEYSLFSAAAPDWKPQPSPDGTYLFGWVGF